MKSEDKLTIKEVMALTYLTASLFCIGNLLEYRKDTVISLTPQQHSRKIYTQQELIQLRHTTNKSPYLRELPISLIRRIRSLKINKKRKRGRSGGVVKDAILHSNINQNNLITVATSAIGKTSKINLAKFGTINVRSIKNKEHLVHDYFQKNKLDWMILTETWLKPKDIPWANASQLNIQDLHISNAISRINKTGGRVSLVYKDGIDVKLKENGLIGELEYAIWDTTSYGKELSIVGVYLPPPSSLQFLDWLLDLFEKIKLHITNFIITGDFNVHVNKPEEEYATQFNNILNATALHQHVLFSTHRLGNTLDLILTNQLSHIGISNVKAAQYISDHRLITGEISVQKHQPAVQFRTGRKLKNIDSQDVINELNLHENQEATLDSYLECFNQQNH